MYHIRTEHVGSTIVLRIRMKDTKQHLCFVATGPLCSPEVVDERNLRTGEGLSEDATESVVLLDDTASSAMALPHLQPMSLQAFVQPHGGLVSLLSSRPRGAPRTLQRRLWMVTATGTITVTKAPNQAVRMLWTLRDVEREK